MKRSYEPGSTTGNTKPKASKARKAIAMLAATAALSGVGVGCATGGNNLGAVSGGAKTEQTTAKTTVNNPAPSSSEATQTSEFVSGHNPEININTVLKSPKYTTTDANGNYSVLVFLENYFGNNIAYQSNGNTDFLLAMDGNLVSELSQNEINSGRPSELELAGYPADAILPDGVYTTTIKENSIFQDPSGNISLVVVDHTKTPNGVVSNEYNVQLDPPTIKPMPNNPSVNCVFVTNVRADLVSPAS